MAGGREGGREAEVLDALTGVPSVEIILGVANAPYSPPRHRTLPSICNKVRPTCAVLSRMQFTLHATSCSVKYNVCLLVRENSACSVPAL